MSVLIVVACHNKLIHVCVCSKNRYASNTLDLYLTDNLGGFLLNEKYDTKQTCT